MYSYFPMSPSKLRVWALRGLFLGNYAYNNRAIISPTEAARPAMGPRLSLW